MPNPWSVEPEEHKIELVWEHGEESRPFWILVKKCLTVGESRKMMKSISRVSSTLVRAGEPASTEAQFEWTEYSFVRAMTFLLDWSLADDQENKLPLKRDSLESLHPSVFDLIDNAIDQHETQMSEVQSKKTKAGGQKRRLTSVS